MKGGPKFLLAAAMLLGAGWAGFSRSEPSRPGDGGSALKATINGPSNLAFDAAGNLFVYERSDDRPPAIREILTGAQTIKTLLIGCDLNRYPSEKGDCLGPVSELRAIGNDRLLVTEFTDNRVRTFDLQSKKFVLVAGSGSLKSSGDGGPATAAGVVDPRCAALDPLGNLFVCDRNRVRRVDARTGIVSTVAGSGKAGFGGDHGLATDAQFNFPSSIAVNAHGDLFISDNTSGRIREVDAKTGIIETIAGTPLPEESRFGREFRGEGGPALQADLFEPTNLMFDQHGGLLFRDFESRVCRIDLETGKITTIAGTGRAGYKGDGNPATRAQINVWAMALDPRGNLYLADGTNNRIRRVDAVTGIITTIAGNGLPHRKIGPPIL